MVGATIAPAGTQTLVRGIGVIRAIANGARSSHEVMTVTGLGHSTVHRLIRTLRIENFLTESVDGSIQLGPALIELGFQALDGISLQSVAHPILVALAQHTKDTVHLAVEDSGSALYLDKVHGNRSIEIRSWPGCRMPLSYTGIGKALMLDSPNRWRSQYIQDRNLADRNPEHDYANESAFHAAMAKFARQGFAYDLEENESGIRCVSAPVRDGRGGIVAAISVCGAAQFMPSARLKALGSVVVDSANCISAELGYKTASNELKE